jgi:Cys-rich protein (TIGR01571 family)
MTWPSTLFDIFNVKDAGMNCCIQHTFCGLCVWGSALEKADVGAENVIITAVVSTIVAALSKNRTVDAVADGIALGAFIKARRKLVDKYKIEEPVINSIFIRCCCAPCAQVQEVNAIMVNENLEYGCAKVRKVETAKIKAPKPQVMSRKKMPKSRTAIQAN